MTTKLLHLMTLTSTAILLAGCSDLPTRTLGDLQSPNLARGGKPGKPTEPDSTVPLKVAFRASATDAIASDSVGEYPYEYDGIFRENGSFITSAHNQGRGYSFDFDPDSADLEPDEVLPSDGRYTGYISTGAPGSLGATAIYPEPDSEGRTSGVVLWETVTQAHPKDIVTTWYLYFGTDCALVETPEKRFVVKKDAPDTWTLGAPENGNRPILCRSPQKRERGLQKVGEIYMPFLLTKRLVP